MKRISDLMKKAGRGFAREEDGLVATEMILMFPLYLFAIMGTYTYWDAWDVVNRSQKAAYTVSDLITRQYAPVSEDYVEGLFGTMSYMMGPSLPTETRITSIFYNGTDDTYEVIWSRASGGTFSPLTTDTVLTIESHLPDLADGDSIVVVETITDFEPLMGESVYAFIEPLAGDKKHVVVTRPRFVPKICMLDVACG
ncbi:MAG: hypothetical protein JXR75_00860 [Rhodobacteraceae bacterium]|nr:hypothetical protein [Paracoccaceae bacterium]